MPLLRIDNLTKRFPAQDQPAVDDLSFEVRDREIFALLGPSGCGKTTTLRIIAGFERPDHGEVRSAGDVIEGQGKRLQPERRRIGLIFQEHAIFPHLSVVKNVMFGLHHLPRRQRRERAMQMLRMTGLEAAADRRPHQLSGGQQQRVALARSIAPEPRILLMDEPLANLDAALRQQMRSQVRALLKERGISALLVTHDQEEAMTFADRIGVMRRGRILQTGTPEEVYHRPRTAFVAQFLGRTNLFNVQARGEEARTPLGPIRLDKGMHGPAVISMRPEHLRLEPPRPGRARGTVTSREFKGHDLTLRVRCDGHDYLVQTEYACPFVVGDEVSFTPREKGVVVEGGEGG